MTGTDDERQPPHAARQEAPRQAATAAGPARPADMAGREVAAAAVDATGAGGVVGAADAGGAVGAAGSGVAQGGAADAVAGGDAGDALYVLSAVLLTPARYPAVLGDDYAAACAALRLEPHPDGYGLVFGQDAAGARWTVVCADVARVAVALAAWDAGMEPDLSPEDSEVVASLPGWPLELAVTTPGLPEPHDPEPDAAGPPLTPPDPDRWGPAQRRLGADEIALQWEAWRGQLDDADVLADVDGPGGEDAAGPSTGGRGDGDPASGGGGADGGVVGVSPPGAGGATGAARPVGATDAEDTASATGVEDAEGAMGAVRAASTTGATDAEDAAGAMGAARVVGVTGAEDTASATGATGAARVEGASGAGGSGGDGWLGGGVRRVLGELRGYVESPPPLGRVRSSFAGGEARTLRADGPGWSVVARTDDIALVLLDEAPGEVFPIGRGPGLPGLLRALDEIATKPDA